MKRIFVPTRTGSDWRRLLAKPELHWKKGRSAMTTAAAWEATADSLPPEITNLLDSSNDPLLQKQALILALPEWQVALEGGETSSNTDVLAICRNDLALCAVAVEAKVMEDFGPLVGDKRKDASQGQVARLEYLQALLKVDRFEDSTRYQLLHRTASALITAREFHAECAVMLVHAFDCPPNRRGDFQAFADALGARAVSSSLFRVPSFDGPRLFLAWCNGNPKFRNVELPSAL